MTTGSRKFRFFIAVVFFLLTFGLVLLAFQPYGAFKSFFNSLMPDGNFKSLKEGNAIFFRGLIVLAALSTTALALLLADKWRIDTGRLHQDAADLWRELLPQKYEKIFVGVLAGVTLWGTLMRLVLINGPVSHDEAYTATVFSPSLFYALTNYHAPNNHILHTILVHFSTSIFGFQTWAVRLPALVAGVLIIPAAYQLGKTLYDRHTGLLASILVAGWPVQIVYSANARGYSLVALFTLIILWLGIMVRRERNLIGWALISLFSALGFYAVPVMLFPFGVLFVWLFVENLLAQPSDGYSSRGGFLLYWLLAGLLTCLLTLILYSPVFIYSGTGLIFLSGSPTPFDQAGSIISDNARGMYTEWTASIPNVLLLILGVGFVLGLLFHRRLSKIRFPVQIALVIWVGIVLIVLRPAAWTRIWFSLSALFAIWASAGLAGLIKDVRIHRLRNISAAMLVIAAAVLGLLVAGIQSFSTLPQAWSEKGADERVVLFIKDKLGKNDAIIAPSPQDATLWYYAKIYGIPDRYFARTQSFDHAFIITLPSSGQYRKSVIEEFGLTDVVDVDSMKLLTEITGLNIYEAAHK